MHDPANLDAILNVVVALWVVAFALVAFGGLRALARLVGPGWPRPSGKQPELPPRAGPARREPGEGRPPV
jgi:hypothetical protein